mmetsp:Transcript_18567/g.34834  ORF Transcript_18567/g.34834 Transcript_18567/m.34834 type:complete len:321 (+) Transcript_18567:85-1047(+)
MRAESPKSVGSARADRELLGSPDSVKVEFDRAQSPRLPPNRRFHSARGKPRKAPEPWEEILDLVPPPPPAPVAGGVRTFELEPPEGEVNALGSKDMVQRADWTIRRLKVDMKTLQVKYRNLLVPAGQYISSARFQLGRWTATLRFWPNGLYGHATKKSRLRMDLGGLRADSWCAVGLAMPYGAKLRFRLHVGDHWSEIRSCQWQAGLMVHQIWTPPQQEPSQLVDLVVGVEVLQDLTLQDTPGPSPSPWSTTPISHRLPNLDNDPVKELNERQKTLQKIKDGVPALKAIRTDLGLALPSPRFGFSGELVRRSPRCRMTSA